MKCLVAIFGVGLNVLDMANLAFERGAPGNRSPIEPKRGLAQLVAKAGICAEGGGKAQKLALAAIDMTAYRAAQANGASYGS